MSRRCVITGKGPLSGCNVSHSNRKTKTKFYPNVRKASFYSEILGKRVSLKVSSHGMKIIEANYGLDQYLLNARVASLSSETSRIKKMLLATRSAKLAAQNNAAQASDSVAN